MAARAATTIHHSPPPPLPQNMYQMHDQQQSLRKPQVYTLYPDPPIKRLSSFHQHQPLNPSPSQLSSKHQDKNKKNSTKKSSLKKNIQSNGQSQATRLNVDTKVHTHHTTQQSQSDKQQPNYSPPLPRGSPLTPISPPNIPLMSNTATSTGQRDKLTASKQQQQQYQQYPQQQPVYGGSVPRQSMQSTSPTQYQNSNNTPSDNNLSNMKKSNGSNKNVPSPSSPFSQRQEPAATSPRTDRLLTEIPTSSLALSFDRDIDRNQPQDQEKHQQQALQYQQKLRQRPPQPGGEDTDDDSESGSIVSYRRSIHRLSMTYIGRPGVPNISLFASSQRPQVVQHTRSKSGSKDLVESPKAMPTASENFSYQQNQGSPKYGPTSLQNPMEHQYSRNHSGHKNNTSERDDSNRPRIVRSNTEESTPAPKARDIQTPGRSTSADSIYPKNGGNSYNQQPNMYLQNEQNPYPSNIQPYKPNTKPSPTLNPVRRAYEPRPSEDNSQNSRPHQTRNKSEAQRRSEETMRHGTPTQDRSKSPSGAHSQNPFRGGMSHHPLPATTRGAGAGGYGNNNNNINNPLNMHPAHHLPSGGYVRPEEAVGPSNPMPEKAEDYVRQGIEFHELGDISKATHYFRTAAELGDPVGMLMYGLSVRHGWGCTANRVLAFQYLQKSAEHAVGDLNSRDSFASTAAKGELVLAIYELGICFRHGWGVDKNKKTAAYYFEIAANLGDPDAQNDLAWCYFHGIGVKKDMYKSAKYYRLAAAQGQGTIGNQWIWKDKYGGPSSPAPVEKGQAIRAY
ncbi:hypothetical protein BGZ76_010103 [Entomortierella beljakovae]|nr:hypothetical protein BGZ76_010103 [Entomortierella beljakovae]